MEFEFGTNWATYSRYVGDIFGSALAAEGIFAFFLESGFLAILVFGWNKVSPRIHFLSTIMVSLGSMLSAVWIVVAYSWQQTPAGFHIVGEGLNAFSRQDRPPVNLVFQTYHIMVAIGFALIGISLLGLFLWWRGYLLKRKWYLYILVFSVLLPQLANQLGWISAEVGRQPWIVYHFLRTSDALSKVVTAGQIWFSLILFIIIYSLLFVLFLYLLNEKIKHGPDSHDERSEVPAHQ